ncbi:hypothetical protein [Yersinia enterocolitica]|uniref:hypothetical protein n=1 Tax=Yersinia enterocolitica TaxID=630 RepID=UPI003F41BC44
MKITKNDLISAIKSLSNTEIIESPLDGTDNFTAFKKNGSLFILDSEENFDQIERKNFSLEFIYQSKTTIPSDNYELTALRIANIINIESNSIPVVTYRDESKVFVITAKHILFTEGISILEDPIKAVSKKYLAVAILTMMTTILTTVQKLESEISKFVSNNVDDGEVLEEEN